MGTERAALDAAVRAVGKRATALVVESSVADSHVFPATATHFGGNPYFEAGESWPIVDGRPYDFVCQVNLEECADRPEVPFDLFTIFLCWRLCEEGDVQRSCLVRTYRDADPSRAVSVSRAHARDEGDYRVKPCTVRPDPGFVTYPWSIERYPEIQSAAAKFKDPGAAYRASLARLGFHRDFRSRVGGFASWVHDNTLEHADMVLLAQIDYEPKANNLIGDSAPIFIGVAPGDPPRIEADAAQTF
jgi:hypothetical protein